MFHRVKSSCTILGITGLESEYAVAKQLLANSAAPPEQLEASNGRIRALCTKIVSKLQQEQARLVIG